MPPTAPDDLTNQPASLSDWLALLESRHPRTIELGLERVDAVRRRLGLDFACPVVTVGGTNGKGSTCAYLEAVLVDAGYRVGCYTSPHLMHYRERVRVGGEELPDALHVAAFAAVEAARGDIRLTYFEHGTLAAAWLFRQCGVEAVVLEVGLGGRLDAVNAFEPDCAVITSVDLDHQEYLGDTREAIGREKAGIFRAGRPAVVTDPDPPQSLLAHARVLGARLLRLGNEITLEAGKGGWACQVGGRHYPALPAPALPGEFQLANAAAAVAALDALRDRLPVTMQALRTGLARARPPGRFQVVPGPPMIILDVAHNPQAARALVSNLARLTGGRRRLAVLGMLRDKDVAGVVRPLQPYVDAWFAAGLPGPRGLTGEALRMLLAAEGIKAVGTYADVPHALQAACADAGAADIIIVFGSFYTVAAAASFLDGGRDAVG
ncbi:MAG: bifunctional tetrahydrofolate synthase/dihydrofolate synthase [Thiobacillaceae bacterium]